MDLSDITVVLPSLDPDAALCQVVDGLLAQGFRDIILVNDGSASACLQPFMRAALHQEVTLLTHPENRGKGAAIKTAFAYILDHRPRSAGAVTVDGDGQHTPQDVRACAEKLLTSGRTAVLGCRDFGLPGVPWKSRMGNRITRTVLRLLCGISVSDTQTGLRAFPRELLPLLCQTPGERYEYETEALFALKQAQVPFTEVTIQTVYRPGNPSSHFHPFRDSWTIYKRIFTFTASSGISFLVDYGLFTLFNLQLTSPHFWPLSRRWRLFVATFGARAVSSLVNYTLNKKAVFRSRAPVGRTAPRYYALCVLQAAASYGLLFLASRALDAGSLLEAGLKLIVDLLLFLVSFRVQQRWVFS